MPTINRAARRQRILKDKDDRLALITGRASSPPQSLSPGAAVKFAAQSPLLVPRHRIPQSPLSRPPQVVHKAAEPSKNVSFPIQSREESFSHRHNSSNEAWNNSGLDQLISTPLNFLRSINSQQLSYALAVTEQPRMSFSITMAFLVLMSHFGFPFFGNKIISTIILFRPFLILLLSNIALIVVTLLPVMEQEQQNCHKVAIFDGYSWVEDASRAIEVGFMSYDVLKTLFMNFIVYSVIIICGFSLFS